MVSSFSKTRWQNFKTNANFFKKQNGERAVQLV